MTTGSSNEVVDPEDLLEFWFADAATGAQAVERRNRVWFSGGAPFDRECVERFAATLEAAARGELEHWKETARGRLAFILLLDQLSRNIHRGTADAYRLDDRALSACREGVERGHDRQLLPIERSFFYLPMEHSEDREVQALSVQHFEALAAEAPEEFRRQLEANAGYARQHHDIVQRFGRFPHRNAVLGRACTPEEEAYLADDAPRFGQ